LHATSVRSVRINMKMVLVGALGVLALQVVLVLGAYAARIPPEVVDCDRGRPSVEVRVTNVSLDRDTSVVRRELGPCKLWYHVNP
jgi:hypothetical protein